MNFNAFAGNYTWTGSTSTNWAVSSNWSPAGVPSTNDTVYLYNGSTNQIVLDGNRTINRIVITANTIDLNTYELQVSARSSLNGGTITNGNLKLRGTYVYFQGTNFNCTLDVIVGQIKFSGGTFDQTGSFEQNGSASGWGAGGCTFNADVIIKNTGTVYLRMGQDDGDTFNGKLYLYSSGGYAFQMAYGDTSYFNDTIYINSTGSGGINFANGTYGASILGDSACLVTGSSGISAGTIQFKNIIQSATSSNSITASGSVLFNVYSNFFSGKVNFTAPNLVVKSTTFNDSTSLTKTGHTLNNTWDGANVYNGVVTITNGNTSTAYVKLASQNADTYNNDVYFHAGTGAIQAANAGTNIYNGNVSVNGNNVTFNTSGGTLKFAGEQNQGFGGGTSTLTFNKLIVDKAGGSVTLNQPITIDSLLELTNGIIYTDTIITLKATATTTGASNMSYVDGAVKKIGNTAFVFPVGDENTFFPVEISAPSSSSDAFMVTYFSKPQYIGSALDSSLYRVSSCNYWKIERIVGSSNVDVKLYWDSMGCGQFDTLNMAIANWDGSKWKNLGYSQIMGDPNIGSIKNASSVHTYEYFSIAELKTSLAPSCSLGFSRSLPPDFFGFNGSNTIDVDQSLNTGTQTWSDILAFNPPFVQDKKITLMRIPAGTLANFADWRTGWPKLEKDLPFNWDYDKYNYVKINDGLGNELQDVANNLNLIGARPIFTWNVLSSKFLYEVASVYRAHEVNLPVKYIELGNEFYLEDEYYKEVFPSVGDYLNLTQTWINDFNQLAIPQSSSIEWAIVGSDYSNSSGGRRKLWMDNLLNLLPSNTDVAAIVVHDYIGAGVQLDPNTGCTYVIGNQYIDKYFNKVFKDGEVLKTTAINKVKDANSSKFTGNELEVWITEFNNLDYENAYIGTWAHGLFNIGMALKYLESEEITKVVSHTMASDGIFGNIFESECGFSGIKCHGTLPSNNCPSDFTTNKGEFTAVGNALNQFALATKDAVTATQIDFYGNDLFPISTKPGEPLNPELYGWMFTKGNGDVEFLIVNFSFSNVYDLTLPSAPVGSNALLYDQLTPQTIQNVVLGNAVSAPATNFQMKLTTLPHNIATPITLPEGSLTRVYFKIRNLSARLTDDEICENSTTTIVIEGGNAPYTFGTNTNLTISSTSNPNVYDVTNANNLTSTLNTSISVTCSTCTTALNIPITIHENFANDLSISVDGITATANQNILSCPGTPITLEAQFTKSTAGTYSTSGDYHFLWTPDTGITSNTCSTQLPICPEIEVDPERPTKYTVYVTDDFCWQSASVIISPLVQIDLGVDQTICNGTAIEIEPTYIFQESGLALNLTWTPGNTNGQTYPYTPTVAGDQVITLSLEADGSILTNCIVTDEINIKSLNCCLGTYSIIPTLQNGTYASYSEDLVTKVAANCNTCVQYFNANGNANTVDKNQAKVIINLNGHGNTYTINGDFIVDNDIRDQSNTLLIDGYDLTIKNGSLSFGPDAQILVGDKRKLVLENCILANCTSEMWDGISVTKTGVELPPSIELINCTFSGATQAINLARESNFKIEGCVFENNYVDIHLEKYQQPLEQDESNSVLTNNYIRGCTFTSSGSTLIAPYSTVHKFAGITLNDVRRAVIGDSSLTVDYNTFNNSNYGIYSNNSSFECYHSTFSDITNFGGASFGRPIKGVCIYSQSNSDFNDRSMNVGVTTADASLKNYFLKSNYGVLSYGEMNAKIFNNDFGDLNDIDNRITNTGIFTVNSSSKKVYISRNNNFYFYNIGIRAIGLNSFGEYHIGNNYFSHTMSIPTNPVNFEGTAIWVGNSYFLKNTNTPPNLQIFENDIGSPDDLDGQPRIGIFVSLAISPIVQNNHIYFNHSSVPSAPTLGIWMQNTERAFINGNNIINTPTSNTLTNLFLGIRSDRNLTPCISDNTIDYLGNSIQFLGDHGQVSLSINKMHYYDNAISLIKADIGVQGFADFINSHYRTDENEFHHTNIGLQPDRLIGSTANNLVVTWYFNSSNNQIFNLDINNSIDQNLLDEVPLNSNLDPLECPLITDPVARNLTYGSVVGDSARYEENYYDFFYQNSRANLYSILKSDISLLNMEDEADSSFEAFYNTMNATNIEKFDSVRSQIELGDYASALQILNSINDSINIESVLKNVLSICLNRSIVDSSLTSNDSTIFYEVANENQLLYGESSIITRNWLFYEVHDGALGQESRITNSNENIESKFEVSIFPNPTTENLFLKYKEILPHQIKILDVNQRLIFNSNSINYLNLKNIDAGLYFVQFIKEGRVLRTHRFIKL